MTLDDRKLRILAAIIQDYVLTAVPVGSRTITRKYDMGVSPATIRNEMSDLELLGYLDQPHVSAGRVPSGKAYRLYVDMLMQKAEPQPPTDEKARKYILEHVRQLEDVVERTANALSELTHYTSVVMMPGQPLMRISTLQLVPMPRGAALLVIVTDSGIVRDTVIHVSNQLDADALYAISRTLTERFSGRTLKEVQEMLASYARFSGANGVVLGGVAELAAQMEKQSSVDSIAVGGAHNILNYPEYADVEKARAFLSVTESRETMLRLIKEVQAPVSVRIGSELNVPELKDCSLVTAQYQISSAHKGTVGLIGPTRMPYDKVLTTLTTVGRTLTELFTPEGT